MFHLGRSLLPILCRGLMCEIVITVELRLSFVLSLRCRSALSATAQTTLLGRYIWKFR